jgi:sugar lactone lactonase YvrE
MISRARIALLGTLAAVLAGAAGFSSTALGAGAHIYWADINTNVIGEANLNGSEPNLTFITGAVVPEGLTVHGNNLYWANFESKSIGRATLEGKEATQAFVATASEPTGVAADGQHLYWENYGGGGTTLGRSNLEGKEANQEFITGASEPIRMAVYRGHVYWTNRGTSTIGRANTNGTEVEQEFIKELPGSLEGIAVGSGHIYWTSEGKIGRANLEGKEVEPEFITGASSPLGITIGGGRLYWANDASGKIGRANLEGKEVEQEFITGLSGPVDVAIGATAPSASITSPSSGAVYVQGASAPTSFSCAEGEGGPGIESCSDSNGTSTASGGAGHLNTATPGIHSYTVTALSGDGQSAGATIVYAVQPPPTPAPVYKPPVQKHNPVVNKKTGEITLEYEFPEAGSAEAEGQVLAGASLARVSPFSGIGAWTTGLEAKKGKRHAKCKRGFVRRGKVCAFNGSVKYGGATLTVPAAGTYALHIKPRAKVLAALKKGRSVSVSLTLRFNPSMTGINYKATSAVKVHLKPPKKRRRRR